MFDEIAALALTQMTMNAFHIHSNLVFPGELEKQFQT
jgi:hypothetical protein